MEKFKFSLILYTLLASILVITGCAAIEADAAATKARGTVEAGGYTWSFPLESEGNVRVQTNGLPSRQIATTVASARCKKYGRVAQFVKQEAVFMLGVVWFDFNCVR